MVKVAALYVETNGVYYGLEDVDPWDEARDARLYDGPWPVVAHPPCAAWSRWRSLLRERAGYGPRGDDGGCFAAALAAVRLYGGVLEHPALSLAWDAYGLPVPSGPYWTPTLLEGGWVIEIDQAVYGHRARKRTWLYYCGATPPAALSTAPARYATDCQYLWSAERRRTPPAFRDVLLDLARSARVSVSGPV